MKRLLPLLLALLLSGCYGATATPVSPVATPVSPVATPAAPIETAAAVMVDTPGTASVRAPLISSQTGTEQTPSGAATAALEPTATVEVIGNPTPEPVAPVTAPTPPPAPTVAPSVPVSPTAPGAAIGTAPATPPVSKQNADAKYEVKEERTIGAYTVRLWDNVADDSEWDNVGTISGPGMADVQIENMSALNDLTGADITGAGAPSIVVETYTGGAHCCFGTQVYEAGTTLRKVLDAQTNNCAGSFVDYNGDKVYEFWTCDDLFAYEYCPYAMSPKVRVIFEYSKDRGAIYKPASPKYAYLYDEDLKEHLPMAENGKPGDMAEFDGSNKCTVLPAVLDYLYMGNTTEAWTLFDKHYTAADAAQFRSQIQERVSKSPLYVSP